MQHQAGRDSTRWRLGKNPLPRERRGGRGPGGEASAGVVERLAGQCGSVRNQSVKAHPFTKEAESCSPPKSGINQVEPDGLEMNRNQPEIDQKTLRTVASKNAAGQRNAQTQAS
jgi:hypothetical protein